MYFILLFKINTTTVSIKSFFCI
ncbi:hypothetical protein PFFCH_04752 [Plasmodium falciparum FCH/4]|uniref:Uncharacterized protein n=1 Tax=Plasmodium falciparum FCH/4 TaxID=1036724 RepID=A0A024VHK9_PLAFA|nr:hypothetical protein PFFCH_04752 [Plasmodium falciparum FCH/4]